MFETPLRGSLALLAIPLLALLPAGLLVGGCAEDAAKTSTNVAIDAGAPSSCVLGTRACGCTSSGGCDRGLLCNTGRCFPAEGTNSEPDDSNLRPATPAPVIQAPPESAADASTDSGPSSNG
jgi:hypothetical protein